MKSKFLAELIGTFAIVFFGCGSVMVIERFPAPLSPSLVPLVFGLVVATMIYAVGHISGAHFNPAVTLAFAVARHFPSKEVLLYWLAQVSGSLIATAFLWLLLPEGSSFGATIPQVLEFQALVWEAILSFFLMFVIIAVATDTRAEGTMAGIAIGAFVTVAAAVGGPVTGASMNPARSLGPNLFQGEFQNLWIYLVGPTLGAILAALAYESIRCHTDKKNAKGCC